jgi:hypothetical protein
MTERRCGTCGSLKPEDAFYSADPRCKACELARAKARNARPEIKARTRARDAARRADPMKRAALNAYSRHHGKSLPREVRMIDSAKERAKAKGLPFAITKADIPIPQRCPLLGIVLSRGPGKLHAASPSLDRKDPSKGYVPGNVWVISYRANAIKNDATLEELELLTRNLRLHL